MKGRRAQVREQRSYRVSGIELRAAEGDNTRTLVGHAAVFDSLSENLGGFREEIAPGAFKRTLKNGADVRFLINHEDLPLARTKSGTLKLSEDETGLKIEAAIDPSDPDAQRLLPKIERGDVDQMSFMFRAVADEWREGVDPETKRPILVRRVTEAQLFDVSAVTFPAYPATDLHARNLPVDLGLDVDALAGALVRAKLGAPITEADRALAARAIEAINTCFANASDDATGGAREAGDPRPEPHSPGAESDSPNRHSLALRRKRLAMLARESN